MSPEKQSRRHDIDRLRIFAMLVVFFFHCCAPFINIDRTINNKDTSMALILLVGYMGIWQMPLFFLVSGAGSFYALSHRRAAAYIWDRVKRLLVPFYGVGIFILLPPLIFWKEVSHGRFKGAFLEFYPTVFTFSGDKNPANLGSNSFFSLAFINEVSYLWFLYSLFFISVFVLPLMIYLKGDRGKAFIEKLASLCARRGGVFLLIIPLYLFKLALGIGFDSNFNWPEQFHYMFYFLFGYMMVSDSRFVEAFKRDWWIGLLINIFGSLSGSLAYLFLPDLQEMVNTYNYSFSGLALTAMITTCGCWGFLMALLGLGGKYVSGDRGPVLSYGNNAVLPFYLLHATFIVGVAFYVVQLSLPIWIKLITIFIVAFVLSIGSYELFVRRFNPMRVLFGMRLKKKPDTSSG